MLLMVWWFKHLFQVVPALQLCCRCLVVQGHLCSVVPLVQLRYWCLVVQDHLCSVVPPVQLRYWSLVVQGHLCSVVPVVQLRYWCLVVQGHLCCSTSSVVWLELVLFSWLVNLFICSFIHLFVCSLRENIIDTLCSTVITVTDNGSSRWSTNCVYRIIRCEFIQNSSEKWGVPCNCAHSWHILSWKLKIVMGRRESLLHICCIFT